MYNLEALYGLFEQFKKEANDSSVVDGKKPNKSAAQRARVLSGQIRKELVQFKKASLTGNV